MNTIYHLLNPHDINKKVVELINTYDHYIYILVRNGKVIDEVEVDEYQVMESSYYFLPELLENNKINPEKVSVILYDFEAFARSLGDYDVNNYKYKDMVHLVENNMQHSEKLNTQKIIYGEDY